MGQRHQVKKKSNLSSVKHKASHSHAKKKKKEADYCTEGNDKEAIRNLHGMQDVQSLQWGI